MVLNDFILANLVGNGGYPQVKRVLVTVSIILCAVATPCESRDDQRSCGKQHLVGSRIARGEDAQLGEWPWHAAILWTVYDMPKYACGGSIIHKRAVISSAHCFVSSNRLVHADFITVHVGRVNLNETSKDQQVLNVSKLIAHPDFLTRIGIEYDIAFLKLSSNIETSPFVFPVCVWDFDDDQSQLVGKTGIVVGFGMNEYDEMSSILQKAELTVVDIYACLDNDRATYGRVLTRHMYCAGGKQNVSACNGDSGGGMFFEVNGTWFIRGIISFIAMRPNASMCDFTKYTVFTDVSKFKDWVVELISEVESDSSLLPPCESKAVPKGDTCNVAHFFEHNFLLVGETNVMRVPLNGEERISVSEMYDVIGLDHDCAEGRFYWSTFDTKQILSGKYDGTDLKLFIEKGIERSANLAVDWISRRLYWADRSKKCIEVASLEDPNVRTVLFYEKLDPYAIAVDPVRRKLYWLNSFDDVDKIEWSNIDGSNRQVLVSHPQISYITSIKVSAATGELCYVDYRKKKIACIDPASKQIRTIVTNLITPKELAITKDLFYWTDRTSKTIESINSNGVRQEPISISSPGFSETFGMTIVSDACPLFYSPCAINNGDCPERTICLVDSTARASRRCILNKRCYIDPDTHKCISTIVNS